MAHNKIRVLVVDDSAFMRKALKRMLSSDPMIRVVGDAHDGEEALRQVALLKPDVVTLDIKMPGMDGIQALKRIMNETPTPVLMISSLTTEGGSTTLQALDAGAVDFIDKSACHTTLDILEIADSLIQKVKVLAGVNLKKVAATKAKTRTAPPPAPEKRKTAERAAAAEDKNPGYVVALGASTGGPMALEVVLTSLPGNFSGAILIVQHMPVGFTKSLADRLNGMCQVEVLEAEEDQLISPGKVFIAPGGYHLKMRKAVDRYKVALSKKPYDTQHCPSVDVMFESVAQTWKGRTLGVVMTGMGSDGARGTMALKEKGASVIAQNEETCVVFGMPKAAYLTGAVDRLVPLERIGTEINGMNR